MSLTAEELIDYCRGRLSNFKIPRQVEYLEAELPKSGSGKVLKRVLREQFSLDKSEKNRPVAVTG